MDLMPQETSLLLRGRHQACLWPGQKPFRQSCLRCCWSSIFETLYHDNLRAALHVHAGTGDVYLFEGHMRIWRESSDSAIFLFPVLAYWMFTCLFFSSLCLCVVCWCTSPFSRPFASRFCRHDIIQKATPARVAETASHLGLHWNQNLCQLTENCFGQRLDEGMEWEISKMEQSCRNTRTRSLGALQRWTGQQLLMQELCFSVKFRSRESARGWAACLPLRKRSGPVDMDHS